MEKFKKYKLELKGLITGGEWVDTNAGCDDPDCEWVPPADSPADPIIAGLPSGKRPHVPH